MLFCGKKDETNIRYNYVKYKKMHYIKQVIISKSHAHARSWYNFRGVYYIILHNGNNKLNNNFMVKP